MNETIRHPSCPGGEQAAPGRAAHLRLQPEGGSGAEKWAEQNRRARTHARLSLARTEVVEIWRNIGWADGGRGVQDAHTWFAELRIFFNFPKNSGFVIYIVSPFFFLFFNIVAPLGAHRKMEPCSISAQ